MSSKINKILEDMDALPSQENWEKLQIPFRDKYREMEVYMADPTNNTQERTPELARMDHELCDLLYELHDIEFEGSEIETTNPLPEPEIIDTEVVPVQETPPLPEPEIIDTEVQEMAPLPEPEIIETENEKNTDMKKHKSPIIEGDKVDIDTGKQPENIQAAKVEYVEKAEPVIVEQAPVVNPVIPPVQPVQVQPQVQTAYPEFLAFAQTQEVVSAKDLVRFNVPPAMWQENKPEFVVGNLRFVKTVAGLIFNSWEVKKT